MEVEISQLKQAVEGLHDCKAIFDEVIAVSETFDSQTVWEGVVHAFTLEGHPIANRAYVWSEPIEGTQRRKFFAVLHDPPIESASDAIRAAIVQQVKRGSGRS